MFEARRALRIGLVGLCLALTACAAAKPQTPSVLPPMPDRGTWLFRHKVRLEIPGARLSQGFDGVMRLDTAQRRARVAGVTGLGMQLFDMEISAESAELAYLHPLLARMPRAGEHIARCVRRVWFDCLARIPLEPSISHDDWNFSATGGLADDLWPVEMTYVDAKIPYTVQIRLVQAEKDEP
ncbi:MAG: hypothetical protein LBH65_06275 [Desulfovibrio sp.]|jgi:hypothetical protein|nr:hypothetical protein [Desulfovibrio sp.]